MAEQIVIQDDIEALVSQSNKNLNMILAEMTSLMEDNNEKIAFIENQNWYQRMSNTILGKNKMTQEEISQNHEKINLYISQSIGELFNRNCIDHEIILGLGNKINELYESQVEIKVMIGAFVQKLNQKIESIDNFHMLITEINQGKYSEGGPLLSISKIMSQLDLRTVQDQRKMDILKSALEAHGILSDEEIYFSKALEDLLTLNENEAGVLALFFGNIRNEYIAEITEQTLYAYYSLPDKTRKMKNKHSVVESILKSNDIDTEYKISSYEICTTLIDAYLTNIVEAAIEEQKNELDEKRNSITEYVDNSMNLLIILRFMVDTWDADSDEMNTYENRKEYSEFMLNIIDNLNMNSYVGRSIFESLDNLTFLAQNVFLKHPELRIDSVTSEDVENLMSTLSDRADISSTSFDTSPIKVNANVALEVEDGEYKTISEYFKSYIKDMFNNAELNRTRQLYSLENMNQISAEFPDPSAYNIFQITYLYMEKYVALYHTFFVNILYNLDNDDFLEEIYKLTQRFPVVCDEQYVDILVRDTEHYGPYIEFEYPEFGHTSSSIGYASLGYIKNYSTTVVLVKLRNLGIKQYTVNFSTIDNSYVDFDTWTSHKYIDIKWGDWIDEDVIELKIIKNHSELGSAKIKIMVRENPNIVGFLSVI